MSVPHEGGKKRKGSRMGKSKKVKGKKAKTTSSPEPASSSSPAATRAEVLNTFPETYKAVIKSLPTCLWPTASKHGQHSYTVYLGSHCTSESYMFTNQVLHIKMPTDFIDLRWIRSARVEVLLRQMAFKPKANAHGQILKGEAARSSLFLLVHVFTPRRSQNNQRHFNVILLTPCVHLKQSQFEHLTK